MSFFPTLNPTCHSPPTPTLSIPTRASPACGHFHPPPWPPSAPLVHAALLLPRPLIALLLLRALADATKEAATTPIVKAGSVALGSRPPPPHVGGWPVGSLH
jgi:hypothetical protein